MRKTNTYRPVGSLGPTASTLSDVWPHAAGSDSAVGKLHTGSQHLCHVPVTSFHSLGWFKLPGANEPRILASRIQIKGPVDSWVTVIPLASPFTLVLLWLLPLFDSRAENFMLG